MNMAAMSEPNTMMPARGDPEDAARRRVQVVQRIPRRRCRMRTRSRRRPRSLRARSRRWFHVGDRGEVDRDDEGADEDGRHDAAEVVDRIARLVDVTRDEHDRRGRAMAASGRVTRNTEPHQNFSKRPPATRGRAPTVRRRSRTTTRSPSCAAPPTARDGRQRRRNAMPAETPPTMRAMGMCRMGRTQPRWTPGSTARPRTSIILRP